MSRHHVHDVPLSRPLGLGLAFILVLLVSACGDAEPVTATGTAPPSNGSTAESPADEADAAGDDEAAEDDDDATAGGPADQDAGDRDPFIGDESGRAALTITDLDFTPIEAAEAVACRTGANGYETYLITTDGGTTMQISLIPQDDGVAVTIDAALQLSGELYQVGSYDDTTYGADAQSLGGESYLTSGDGTTVIAQWSIDLVDSADCGGVGGALEPSPGAGLGGSTGGSDGTGYDGPAHDESAEGDVPGLSYAGSITLGGVHHDVVGGCIIGDGAVISITLEMIAEDGRDARAQVTHDHSTEETDIAITDADGLTTAGRSLPDEMRVSDDGFAGSTTIFGPTGSETPVSVDLQTGGLPTC